MALFICPNWHFTYPSANLIETYEYDYLGNRTAKTSGGVKTEYTTDLSTGYSQVLKATTGSKAVYYTRGFELISRQESSAASYYIYDGGLSVRALTNEAGTVTDTLVFDAFGNETVKTGSSDNSYGFQGEEIDMAKHLDLFQLAMVVEFGYRFAKCTRKMLSNYITSWVMLKLKLYLEFMVSIVNQIIGNLTLMHLRRIELILEKKLYMIS